jgi:hypothetical protein
MQAHRLTLQQVVFAAELLYLWSSSLIKLSILSFHTRLAKDTLTPRFVLAVRMSIVFIVLYMITFTIVLFFTCQPFVCPPGGARRDYGHDAHISAELLLEPNSPIYASFRGKRIQLSVRGSVIVDKYWHKHLSGTHHHRHLPGIY